MPLNKDTLIVSGLVERVTPTHVEVWFSGLSNYQDTFMLEITPTMPDWFLKVDSSFTAEVSQTAVLAGDGNLHLANIQKRPYEDLTIEELIEAIGKELQK